MASWRRHLFFLLCLVSYLPACGNDTVTDGGVQCTRNEECGVGEYCKNGICTPYQTCSSDEDCSQGEICHLGVCEPGSRPDAGDGSDAGDGGEEQNDGGDPAADQPEPRPKITLAGDVIVHEDQQGKTYEINYGSVTIGTPVTRVLIIRNTGDAVLEVDVINIDMDPNSEFRIEPSVPPKLVIEPGGEEPLGVIYAAKDGLTDLAVAKIFSNDPEENQIPLQLISEFKGDARIVLDPTTLDFGDVPLDLPQPPLLSAEISNQGTGNAVLRIDSALSGSPAFQAVLMDPITETMVTPPIYLNRGEFIRADVTFIPTRRDSFVTDLVIQSSDENSPSSAITLSGRADIPAIAVTPGSINFGQVPANALPVEQPVTIRNLGVGDLNVSSITLNGTSPDISLAGVPDPIPPLAPLSELVITVRYLPTNVGTDTDILNIQSDDPDRPVVLVDVGGEGIQGNAKPTAVIWANGQDTPSVTVLLNEQVALDGTHSFDADGTVNAYQWRIVQQPGIHPCGQESTLSGSMLDVTSIRLREAGLTTIGLKVQDDLLAWSEAEDLLEIHVEARPQADIRVGGNTTGYIEVDMGDTITFDGTFSSDCDGVVSVFRWNWVLVPQGRGGNPNIGGGNDYASVLFDFPGLYAIQLVVTDDDGNDSDAATFDVLVKGPRAFRVTADWFDMGNSDHHVDVDLHLLKPGSTNLCSLDDCYPRKPGGNHPNCDDGGNTNPNWGILGAPVYQRDSWEDADGSNPPNPANPADEINFPNPGMGAFGIYVTFRCHSSTQLAGDYMCCDDMCTLGCPLCVWCGAGTGSDNCVRKAVGEMRLYVTDYNGSEAELTSARRQFSFDDEEQFQYRKIGTISWPSGDFQ